ncbi:substrate-binding periplasmic protein [Dongshaea marina]|uniref:substrate-binding periplasmic protein n=1 Tax=Dongshaea marina TaxID=2047966 RepID=UPI000D3E3FC8|nr:transporter substrate-binding domain-containing protein [Dongshaea marina]
MVCTAYAAQVEKPDWSKLTFVTEEYPPYNYIHNSKLKGMAVDLLLVAAREAGQPLAREDIKVYSWARAYKMTLNIPNVVLFSTARSKPREKLFHWVGPIVKSATELLALRKRNLSIKNIDDLKNYRIGVVRADIGEQDLLNLGFPKEKMSITHNHKLLIRQLRNQKIDFWAYELYSAKHIYKQQGLPAGELVPVYELSADQLYYALNLNTDPKLLESFSQAVGKVRESGELDKILSRYQ